jgi:hypothetical protein
VLAFVAVVRIGITLSLGGLTIRSTSFAPAFSGMIFAGVVIVGSDALMEWLSATSRVNGFAPR